MEMKGDPTLAPTRPLGEGRGDHERPRSPTGVPRAAQDRTREPQERPKLGLGVLSMLLCNSHVKTCCPSTLGPIAERYVH